MLATTSYMLLSTAARFLGSHRPTSTVEPLHVTRLALNGDGTYDRTGWVGPRLDGFYSPTPG